MGRGDSRTRKGKISKASYGNARPHTKRKSKTAVKPGATKPAAKTPVKKK